MGSLTADDIAAFLDNGSVLSDKSSSWGKPNLFDPLQFSLSETGGKHLFRDIRDFTSLVPKGQTDTYGHGSIQIGSQQFALKDTKIPWERINIAQYMEGSLKILREMALHDKCCVGKLLEYVNYLVKIATLGQCFQWSSVLKYDQEYRKSQAATGFTWGADNSYLMQLYLKSEPDGKQQQTQIKKQPYSKSKKAKFDPESGTQICMKWNSVAGCNFRGCKFAHKCMTCYSTAHPQHACNNNSHSSSSAGNT